MPTIRFTDNIQRHVECPAMEVEGARVREVLDAYFRTNRRARGYVLDDQGRLREHMWIFIDGAAGRECVRSTCRPNFSTSRTRRMRIWSSNARQLRPRCGCNITMAFSDQPIAPHRGARSRMWTLPRLDLRSPSIHAIRRLPGSCRR